MDLYNKTKSSTINPVISVGIQQCIDATFCPMIPVRSLFSVFSKYSSNSWLLNQLENSPQKGNFSSQARQQFQFALAQWERSSLMITASTAWPIGEIFQHIKSHFRASSFNFSSKCLQLPEYWDHICPCKIFPIINTCIPHLLGFPNDLKWWPFCKGQCKHLALKWQKQR